MSITPDHRFARRIQGGHCDECDGVHVHLSDAAGDVFGTVILSIEEAEQYARNVLDSAMTLRARRDGGGRA